MAHPHKRHFKNFLLDRSFQLKYAGLLFGVAALLSAVLGMLLYNESRRVIEQSETAVQSGQQALELGRQVSAESRKVTEVVRMNLVKEPVYADNPELLEEFQAENKEADAKVLAQEQELEDRAAALAEQADQLAVQRTTMLYVLFGVLGLLAVLMGVLGIVFTHRVAGPIFKMKRQIHTIGEGDWRMPAPLRKGDELAEFFHAFEDMVKNLRAQREHELALLAEARDDPDKLDVLQNEMERVLAK